MFVVSNERRVVAGTKQNTMLFEEHTTIDGSHFTFTLNLHKHPPSFKKILFKILHNRKRNSDSASRSASRFGFAEVEQSRRIAAKHFGTNAKRHQSE